MSLKQKTALITGGTKGIGYGIAEALLKEGVNVAITGRDATAGKKAADSLSKIGSAKVLFIQCDVRDLKQQQDAVNKVVSEWGTLDVLVANAGVGHFASIEELSVEKWKETIDINLTGVFYSIKAAVDALKKSKGYFITISSLAGTNF